MGSAREGPRQPRAFELQRAKELLRLTLPKSGVPSGLKLPLLASQVRTNERKALRQYHGETLPHRMGLRIAVQQQQRWPGSTMPQPDLASRHVQGGEGKAVEEHRRLPVATSA